MGMTELDVKREIRRLAVAYGKPPEAEAELVGLWRHVLEDVPLSAVQEAVSRYVKSDARYFPRAGMIRTLARQVDGEHIGPREAGSSSDWNATQEGPCPVCGAVLQLADDPNDPGTKVYDARRGRWRDRTPDDPIPPRRYRVLHDGWAHKAAGVPPVGDVVWRPDRDRLRPPARSA